MTETVMTCPRACGIDVRLHHSTDEINGGCDTGPMSLDDMRTWFEERGVQPVSIAAVIAEHYGKAENELNEMYEAMHGMA